MLRHFVHGASGVRRAEAQADRDAAIWRQQHGELAQRPVALLRGHMHPHCREQDQVEAQAEPSHLCEVGQAIVQPSDPCRPMQGHREAAHFTAWLDGDHIIAAGC